MPITKEQPVEIKEAESATQVKTLESEERQTIVHCQCNGEGSEAYRIWPSTFLVERGSDRKAKLITAYNISFAPNWTLNDGRGFTLIFEGLSKECSSFDLIEVIPQAGGFEVLNIARNKSDVYGVSF
ncbi:MAG: hypothetical protein SGJ15_14630 [Bacteroidota bacterium]|nr:hypothetical protein [Bacteroidota bacterium]